MMSVPRSVILTQSNMIIEQHWTVDKIKCPDSCKHHHVCELHTSSTGKPALSQLFWLLLNLLFWGAKGNRITPLFVCLPFVTSTKQSQTDGWLCCLLPHSLTWMNIKGNAQKRWNLIMCHLYGFCVTEGKRWNTFRRIIALVNNGGLPVLHSIMESGLWAVSPRRDK